MSHGPLAIALGLLGFAVFVVAVVALAAGVTWVVVRLSPSRERADGVAMSSDAKSAGKKPAAP